MQFSPDGSKVLYLADQDTNGIAEAYVRIVRDRANTGGGDWDTAGSWDQNVAPDEVMQVFIDTPSTVTATGNTTTRTVNELVLGGGAGTSTLALEAGAIINAMHGFSIQSGGVLRGDGRIAGDVTIVDGGEIRVAGGQQLQIGGSSFANAGRIEAIGTAFAPAEIEFDGAVTNDATTGAIFARDATLRFNGGLTNDGAFAMSFGTTDVFGDLANSATGTIAVGGNSGVTFYDDVDNSGTLNVFAGSTAVFFGDLRGSGNVGGGNVQALGDLLPGVSPGTMVFGGDLTLGGTTTLGIEIAGTTSGSQYDTLDIAGVTTLDGTLDVSFLDGFTPAAGDTFEIITAASLVGTFGTETLPALAGGLEWFVNYSSTAVELVSTFAGDFDFDGDVDGGDFLKWQRGFGTDYNAGDLADWKANYGAVAPLAAASTTVPEPTSLAFIAVGLLGMSCRRRKQA